MLQEGVPVSKTLSGRISLFVVGLKHFIPALLAIASLIIPVVVCTVPATPKAHAADCCQHMGSRDCGTESMSACCEIAAPTAAVAPMLKRAPEFSWVTLSHTVNIAGELSAPPSLDRLSLVTASPPGFGSSHSNAILRI